MQITELDKIVKDSIQASSNRYELWINLLEKVNAKIICEVGVWKGDFANYILNAISTIEQYTFIDPWRNLPSWNKPFNVSDNEFDNVRSEALDKNKKYAAKINELRMTTKDAAKKIPNETFDFSYIDGDHTLRGITIDLNVLYSKTRVNGLIGGDDFTRNIWQHSNKYDPTEVFPYAIYFAEANDCTIFTLPYNQFLIFKNSSFEVFDYGNYSELTVKQIYSKKSYIESLKKIVHNKLVKLSKK